MTIKKPLLMLPLLAMYACSEPQQDIASAPLPGGQHASLPAQRGVLLGHTKPSLDLEKIILVMKIPAKKKAALDRFLEKQQDIGAPEYHQWLTPQEFGARFGPNSEDFDRIQSWLLSRGFRIEEISPARTSIDFSGTVEQVEQAFRTQINDYSIDGVTRHANALEPSLPTEFSESVAGIASLNNIPIPSSRRQQAIDPNYTDIWGTNYLSPADFSVIYNVSPLYSSGIDGSGQSIAIVGRTHPSSANWAYFRTEMALPPNPPIVIINGTDPGDIVAEDGEADLDVEWSGAIARNATIKFVASKSTGATDGVTLSAQYIVNNNIAPIMSISFGQCEANLGSALNTLYNNLYAQAAAQGITSIVSSGDSGAAGCDNQNTSPATGGLAVSGLASTPYNIAVGGTRFSEGAGTYWDYWNGSGERSARSYIPEVAWNESGSTVLWSTGGGVSQIYGKPVWQQGPGVLNDGMRDVPDISLSAASHDGYRVFTQGAMTTMSGTSASAPSFAGIMALVVQQTGQRQGNANFWLYKLADSAVAGSAPAAFHDITAGNNTVPGVAGYSCGPSYDLATGLGSVDAYALVTGWQGPLTNVTSFVVSSILLL